MSGCLADAAASTAAALEGRDLVARLRLEPRVVRGGVAVPPVSFGTTTTAVHVEDIAWRRSGGRMVVDAALVVECRWDVDDHGRTDVPGALCAAVTSDTWSDVADDLEPDDTGRPARRRYWASDLSIRHEQSHIDDDLEAAAAALVTATAWLDGRQADSEEEVLDLLARVQHDVKAAIERHHLAGGERRARAADQDLYARRAATIRARAGAEGWAGATCPAAGTTTTKRGTT